MRRHSCWWSAASCCPRGADLRHARQPSRYNPGWRSVRRISDQDISMARLQLEFPEDQYYYATQLTVRVTDINGANHLGNDSMISMISEARARFMFDFGLEQALEQDIGTIVTDLATTYRTEAHARDQLLFEAGVMDFNTYGGDITFRITRPRDQALVAMAKSGFVFFNYKTRKVVPMPEAFYRKFERVNWL
jgi:acyl-CoA thioesterase FadM